MALYFLIYMVLPLSAVFIKSFSVFNYDISVCLWSRCVLSWVPYCSFCNLANVYLMVQVLLVFLFFLLIVYLFDAL